MKSQSFFMHCGHCN